MAHLPDSRIYQHRGMYCVVCVCAVRNPYEFRNILLRYITPGILFKQIICHSNGHTFHRNTKRTTIVVNRCNSNNDIFNDNRSILTTNLLKIFFFISKLKLSRIKFNKSKILYIYKTSYTTTQIMGEEKYCGRILCGASI